MSAAAASSAMGTDSPSALEPPQSGQWIKLAMTDGSTRTCRLVRAGTWAWSRAKCWWHIDHGAYGSEKDESWLRESSVVSAVPTQRPALLLTFVDPFGRVRRVGRYATRAEALAAMSHRPYATDVRIEGLPIGRASEMLNVGATPANGAGS